MYRLMIVDDEYLARYSLSKLILREFDNIEIVGDPENGRQAIEQNRSLRPDIIIMDINMPGINGIDASMQIISEFPQTNILILTAYDSFDYIKRALDIGVLGYILKPVKETEVVEKIKKLINEIEQRSNKCDFVELVEAKIKVVKPFMEKEIVMAFATGNFDEIKMERYIDFLQEDIKAGYFMLISSGQHYSNEINDSIRNSILKEKTMNILTRHLPLMKKCLFGRIHGDTIVVFIPVDMKCPNAEVLNEAVMIGQEISRKLKLIGNIDATVGIGMAHSELHNFYKSYNEAAIALKKTGSKKPVVHFQLLNQEINEKPHEFPHELENKLIDQIKSGCADQARKYVDDILIYILTRNDNPDILKEYAIEFITILKRAISKLGVNLSEYTVKIKELMSLDSIEEIELWCKYNAYNLIEKVEKCSNKGYDIINKVIEYICINFNKNITLESVADEIGLTPQYLSKIFKEKYGINFIDFITQKRMEYAEKLLRESEKNIKEIGKLSGYEDSNYFCKIFKKEMGTSPKQYRTKAIAGV